MATRANMAVTGLLALALVATMIPAAEAQTGTSFGSKVAFGDNDFVPTPLAALPAGPSVCRVNLGDQALVNDDGYYLMAAAAGTTPVANNNIRLNSVLSKTPGSFIGDADTVEKVACTNPVTGAAGSAALVVCQGPAACGAAALNLFALNFDTIPGYTGGDCVYLDLDGTGTAAPLTRFDLRLSGCTVGSTTFAAGTLVQQGDADTVAPPGLADFGAVSGAADGVAALGFWNSQPNGAGAGGAAPAILDAGDRIYLRSTTVAALAVFPTVHDIRIAGDVAQFGSKVKFGDNDFVPTLAATPGTANLCRVNLADQTLVNDDGYYLSFGAAIGAGGTVPNNAIRLVSVMGKAAGTLVGDVDTVEKSTCLNAATGAATGSTAVAVPAAAATALTDVNTLNFDSVAGYTSGDCAYINRDASAVAAGHTITRWDIRITDCMVGSASYKAGTLVELGDQDLINAGGGAAAFAFGAAPAFMLWNSQPNSAAAAATVDSGDRVYIGFTTGAAAATPRVHDIRILGDAGQFGSKVKFGDRDFIPQLAAPAAINICRVNLGDQALITDDGFYYTAGAVAGGANVPNNALRIRTVLGKNAGTLVGDADTTEKTACLSPAGVAGSVAVAFAGANGVFALNFDQIPGYTKGDCVYQDLDASGVAGVTRFDLRLTDCVVGSTTYKAGSMVDVGDTDFSNAPGVAAFNGLPAFLFWDNQPNGILDANDRLYIALTGLGAAGVYPTVNDIRLYGDFSQAPGGVTPAPPLPPPPPPGQTTPPPPPPPTPPSEISALLAQITQLNTQLNTSLAQNSELNGRVSELSSQLSEQTTQLTSLNNQLTELRAENTRLQEELTKKDAATKTPGFEAVAVLAALGAALLVLRRKA